MVHVELDDPVTVASLIGKLKEMFGSKFTDNFMSDERIFNEMIIMLINGFNLKRFAGKHVDPFDARLKETDEITFLMQFEGG